MKFVLIIPRFWENDARSTISSTSRIIIGPLTLYWFDVICEGFIKKDRLKFSRVQKDYNNE